MYPAPLRTRFLTLLAMIALAVSTPGCGDVTVGNAESVTALAGAAGGAGFFDGSSADPVRFDSPAGVAVVGTDRFVADTENHVIRKIDASGNVSTFAGRFGVPGSDDGTGAAARFDSPTGIAAAGNSLYVCDTGNHTIRKVVATSGAVTTLAGSAGSEGSVEGTGPAARFSSPKGIATNGAPIGTILFVADTGNHALRKVTDAGVTSPFAGLAGSSGFDDGLGLDARFSSPEGLVLIGTSLLFVADTGNHTIRKILVTASFGDVETLAGVAGAQGSADGPGALARFRFPSGITSDGNVLFVCDAGNHSVRSVTQDGSVTTLAGSPGTAGFADNTGVSARFDSPSGIGTLGGGSSVFYVADTGNHVVRRLTAGGEVTTIAGNPPRAGSTDGSGGGARFFGPAGIAVIGDNAYVADTGSHAIRKVIGAGTVTTIAGSLGNPGAANGTGSAARFRFPGGIAALDNDLYVTDSGNHSVRKVSPTGVVTTIAGAGSPDAAGTADGAGSAARFNNPQGIVALGGNLYVADTGNHTVRRVTPAGEVTTLAGLGGTAGSADGTGAPGGTARFNAPLGIASNGTSLFVADTGNHTVRRIATPSGTVDTFAGSAETPGFADGQGGSARFSSPDGITAVGSVLFVADGGNHAVRRISTTRTVRTFVGTPDAATTRNGNASDALLNTPAGVTGVEGTLYFTDFRENVVRRILF